MTEKRKGKEEIKKRQSRAWSAVIQPIASFAALIGKQINFANEKLASPRARGPHVNIYHHCQNVEDESARIEMEIQTTYTRYNQNNAAA